ncbi:MAG: response regulator [Acidimicrobiia bacterium]
MTERSSNRTSSKIRVLLVDDDEAEFVLIRDLLDEIGPDRYELTWESTYTDGYASLVSGRFDVCLLLQNRRTQRNRSSVGCGGRGMHDAHGDAHRHG